MKSIKFRASLLILTGSVLCFFLPFITISLGKLKIIAPTGEQLAMGTQVSQALPAAPVGSSTFNGDPLAGVALLSAIAGAGLSLGGRKLAAVTAACSGAGALALAIMMSRLSEQMQRQSLGIVQISYEPGLFLAISLLLVGAVFSLYQLFHHGTNVEASSELVQGPGNAIPAPNAERGTAEPGSGPRKVRYCRHCGSAISAGKRFCSQCGKESIAKQEVPTIQNAILPELEKPVYSVPPLSEPSLSAATSDFGAGGANARIAAPAPDLPPIKPLPPYIEEPAPAAHVEVEAEPIVSVRVRRSRKTSWLITAIVTAVVLSAAMIWTYSWHHGVTLASLTGHANSSRVNTPPRAQSQTQTQPQTQAPLTAQTQTRIPPTEPPPKPSLAEVGSVPPQRSSHPPATGRPTKMVAAGSGEAPGIDQSVSQMNVERQSENATAVQSGTPQPRASGTLRYAGPPVHFGETVSFTGLPGARLRFTFDHAVWQPLISRQSNGTQTLTLRSLTHEVQTQCDVRWEIAQ
jgi:hypothetical protein